MNAKKIAIIVGVVLALGLIVGFTVEQSQKNLIAVQTGKVAPADVTAVVTASGEIKPKNYVNIGANAMGKITHLFVKEGDRVRKGQMLAQLENVQSGADVEASRAAVAAARTDAVAAEAAIRTAQADLNRARSDDERTRLDYQRAQELFKAQLIPQSDYEMRKATYEQSAAGLAQAEARLAQARAQKDSFDRHTSQASATLTRASDVLSKTEYTAPYDGVVTNLPVHEAETVVMGIQNAPGSTLMTVADMSVITAEVKVDETDIVNVKIGQPAEITIDAIPKQVFKGHVTEIGDNAIVRSTGVATTQSTTSSQEAKDFKVVVTLDNPPDNLRPGLSTTAKITTSSKSSVLAIPIQALTVRKQSELDEAKNGKRRPSSAPAPATKKDDPDIQGVFVVRNKKAEFVKVDTGIAGTTDIEVLNGLKSGDEIVTGSFRVLRTLRNGATVKVDNSVVVKADDKS